MMKKLYERKENWNTALVIVFKCIARIFNMINKQAHAIAAVSIRINPKIPNENMTESDSPSSSSTQNGDCFVKIYCWFKISGDSKESLADFLLIRKQTFPFTTIFRFNNRNYVFIYNFSIGIVDIVCVFNYCRHILIFNIHSVVKQKSLNLP